MLSLNSLSLSLFSSFAISIVYKLALIKDQ